ncbi:NAD-dependent protein deacylase [Aquibacillus kalidii]|uniref:NAD-dependent protein deacylase n=1 Tax=Aquibacillus kalidii TaxID=2762597 RepID=UPI0016481449|nr:NAD-dependent protein deacylase [Aquibacillus kalidii]
MNRLKELALEIEQAKSIAVLTGAGVSTASGIPDFRSTTGVWTLDHSREYYMSRDYFYEEPEDFWLKYKEIFHLKLLKDYEPNEAHRYLKQLEDKEKNIAIITQNVDGLHTEAGNSNVVEYHGSLNTATCPSCGEQYSLDFVMEKDVPFCSALGCGDVLKPDIVLFGDPIIKHGEAEYIIENSDFLLVLGTSLQVMPFNQLPFAAIGHGLKTALINREATHMDSYFDYVIHEDLLKVTQALK